MRVLVTGHGLDRDAVNAARRLVAYEHLVILTPEPAASDLDVLRENEALAGVDVTVRPVPANDLFACLDTANGVLTTHAREEVRVHVAGGPNLLTSALLLASFQRGVDAFYCHPRGVSRLPVARSVDLTRMFTPVEETVMRGLPVDERRVPLEKIAGEDVPLPSVKTALLRLQRRGLVHATPEEAGLTSTGAYYRRHFRDA